MAAYTLFVLSMVLAAAFVAAAPMGRPSPVAKCLGLASLTDLKKQPLVITGQPNIVPAEVMSAFLARMDLLSVRVCQDVTPGNRTQSHLDGCDVIVGPVPMGVSSSFEAARKPVHAVVFRDPIETTLSMYLELLETPTHPMVSPSRHTHFYYVMFCLVVCGVVPSARLSSFARIPCLHVLALTAAAFPPPIDDSS